VCIEQRQAHLWSTAYGAQPIMVLDIKLRERYGGHSSTSLFKLTRGPGTSADPGVSCDTHFSRVEQREAFQQAYLSPRRTTLTPVQTLSRHSPKCLKRENAHD
jgi:hypothetical protein